MMTENERRGSQKNRWTRWYMWLAYGGGISGRDRGRGRNRGDGGRPQQRRRNGGKPPQTWRR